MPALGQNAVAIMSMDDGGMMNVRAGEGSDYLRIVARPAALERLEMISRPSTRA